mgnify:CR=1 FL=1
MKIHAAALVSPGAELGKDVEIGAFATIGDHVRVVRMEGLKLKVEPTEAPASAAAEGQRGGSQT